MPGHMSKTELLHLQRKEKAGTLQLSAPSLTQQHLGGGEGRQDPNPDRASAAYCN